MLGVIGRLGVVRELNLNLKDKNVVDRQVVVLKVMNILESMIPKLAGYPIPALPRKTYLTLQMPYYAIMQSLVKISQELLVPISQTPEFMPKLGFRFTLIYRAQSFPGHFPCPTE